jgi:ATP-dependent Clp protease ATP-binding subunit ClpC
MFKYLGPETRKAVRLACQVAKDHRYRYVGTEHLLHGVLRADGSEVAQVLGALGTDTAALIRALEDLFENQAGEAAQPLIPFTAHAKRAIESARSGAEAERRRIVTCTDLLAGVLAESTGVAAQIARQFALDSGKLRKALDALPQAAGATATAGHDHEDAGAGPGEPPLGDASEAEEGERHGRRDDAPARKGRTVPVRTERAPRSKTPALDAFGLDLTRRAREGALDPVIGREAEVERLLQVLVRRTRRNPVLVGEPGTGKTALVEALAQRIAEDEVPTDLRDRRVISLDLTLMLAGTRYRGEFEERIQRVMREAEANPEVILFVDELHTIVGAGSGEGSLDAANILKPGLSRGRLQLVGATTTDEFRKHIEKDRALERRFQPIFVRETNREETEAILRGLRPRLEAHHRAKIDDEALEIAVALAERYIAGRFQPDKSIDVIDEAASAARARASRTPPELAKLEEKTAALKREIDEALAENDAARASGLTADLARAEAARRRARSRWQAAGAGAQEVHVTADHVRETVARMTGISLGNVAADRATAIGSPAELDAVLSARVVGQVEACRAVSRAVARAAAGLKDPRRPAGAFLFVGPSGVGKTLLAKALAKKVYGTEDALIAIDMSELMERHDASKLTGSPPGYVGHDRAGGLTERVRRRPQAVVLFDEVEKAHPQVLDLLLQVLDEGRLTDGSGRAVDFRNTIVIMTANLGQQELARTDGVAFGLAGGGPAADHERAREVVRAALEAHFRPELLNRLDDVIHFRTLDEAALGRVLELELAEVKERLAARENALRLTEGAVRALLALPDVRERGARAIRRAVEDRVVTPLSDMLLKGEVARGDEIVVRLGRGGAIELRVRGAAAAAELETAEAAA